MMAWWGLLLAAVAAGSLQSAPSTTSTVTGVVVDAATGDPLPFAYVRLTSYSGRIGLVTTSSRDGVFVFTGVASETYSLGAHKPGRPLVFHGGAGARAFDVAEPIDVRSGRTIGGLRVEVPRAAVIAGRVLDIDGEPAVGVYLRLRRRGAVLSDGRPNEILLTRPTNAKGEFRLWELLPGDYTLSVSREGNILGRRYAHVYFPGVTDATQSELISLEPGEERTGVELRLVEASTTDVEGMVLGADALPFAGASVALRPREERAVPDVYSVSSLPDGSFTFPAITPGEYWLSATTRPSTSRSRDGVGWALMPVSVGSESVSGATLVLQPGLTVKGQLRIDAPAQDPAEVSRLWVTATPIYAGFGRGQFESGVTASGDFEFRELAAGRYHVDVTRERYGPPVTIRGFAVNGQARAGSQFEIEVGASVPDPIILVLAIRPWSYGLPGP